MDTMRGPLGTSTLSVLLFVAASLVSRDAGARETETFNAPYDVLWNTSLRLLRADLGLTITDRDKDAGYVLFDYEAHDKTHVASFEFVVEAPQRQTPHDEEPGEEPSEKKPAPPKVGMPRQPQIVVVAQVKGMPSYVETLLLKKLRRKLAREQP